MTKLNATAVNILLILEIVCLAWSNEISREGNASWMETENGKREINNDTRMASTARDAETGRRMTMNDYHEVEKPKSEKPWLGYYDFLITEGSYKFWVVFQLFTVGVLIYSAFAAIYYAKYTINDYENYDDYGFGRGGRSLRSVPTTETAFLGLPVETYLQIFNAIYNYGNK